MRAEQEGFDSYWFPEHMLIGPDILTAIALAGRETRFIELGTLSLSVFPRHPLKLAQQLATVQAAALDRLCLGLGTSFQEMVAAAYGAKFSDPMGYMTEFLEILNQLSSQDSIDYQGEHITLQTELPGSRFQMPPILLTGYGPEMLDLAGRQASGAIVFLAGPRAIGEFIAPRLNRAAASVGKPRPRLCAGLPIVVTDDKRAARELLYQALAEYERLPLFTQLMALDQSGSIIDSALIGDEAEVKATMRGMKDAGVTDLLASIYTLPGEPLNRSRAWRLLAEMRGQF